MFYRMEILTYLVENQMSSLSQSWRSVLVLLQRIFEMEPVQADLISLALNLGTALLDGVGQDDKKELLLSDQDRVALSHLVSSLTVLRGASVLAQTPLLRLIDGLKLSALAILGEAAAAASASQPHSDGALENQFLADQMKEILHQVKDEMVPVRAMGLHGFKRLCKENFAFAKTKFDIMLPLIFLHLQESDSFIHLNAVQTLAAMVEGDARHLLPTLMSALLGTLPASHTATLDDIEGRVRLGEALIQCIQRFGEANVQHCKSFLSFLYK